MMKAFRLTFTVNGHRTEQIVKASSFTSAKDIVKAQYPGARIVFISTGHEYL